MPTLTIAELAQLRNHPHRMGRSYLYVVNPSEVLVATSTVAGRVQTITCNLVSGAWADALRGQTLVIQDATGTYKGKVRLRANAAVGTLYASEHEVLIAVGDRLVVLETYELWAINPQISATGTTYKDWNGIDPGGVITYPGSNAACSPVPVMGPASVCWLGESHHFDWTRSWAIAPGAAITSYAATFPGGTPPNSVAPSGTVSWATAGARWVTLAVTDSNGITGYTGKRLFITLDPDNLPDNCYVDFVPSPRQGNVDSGGFSMSFTIYTDAPESAFPDGAMVLWFFDDSGTQTGIGGNWPDRTNIKFVGFIRQASTHKEPETGTVTFEATTLQNVMQSVQMFPNFLENAIAPAIWTEAATLTVQRAAYLHVRWQSTLLEMADVIFTPAATTAIGEHEFPEGSLYQQLTGLVERDYRYRVGCDYHSTLYFNEDPQFQSDADRLAIATIMAIQDEDWQGAIDLPEPLEPQTGYVLASGNAFTAPATLTPFFSEAPGPVPLERGGKTEQSRLICTTQANLNILSGRVLAQANVRYPDVRVSLDGQYYIGHLFPQEFVQLATTTKRATPVGRLFVPRRSELQVVLDKDNAPSHCQVSLNLEELNNGLPGQTLVYPGLPAPEEAPAPPSSPTYPGSGAAGPLALISGGGRYWYWCADIATPTWLDRSPAHSAGGVMQDGDVAADSTGEIAAWVIDNGAASATVIRSLDLGLNWDTIVLPDPVNSSGDAPPWTAAELQVWSVKADPNDCDNVYVLARGYRAAGNVLRSWLYYSSDATNPVPTWNSHQLQTPTSGWECDVYLPGMSGRDWMGVGPTGRLWLIAQDFLAPAHPTWQSVPYVFYSDDGGVTWAWEGSPVSITQDANVRVVDSRIAVSSHDEDVAIVYGLWRNSGTLETERVRLTQDGGAAWVTREGGLPPATFFAYGNLVRPLHFHPGLASSLVCQVWSINDIYASANLGVNWTLVNAAWPITEGEADAWTTTGGYRRASSNFNFAAANIVLLTSDGGVTCISLTGDLPAGQGIRVMRP